MRPADWYAPTRTAAAHGFRRGFALGCLMLAPWFLFLYR